MSASAGLTSAPRGRCRAAKAVAASVAQRDDLSQAAVGLGVARRGGFAGHFSLHSKHFTALSRPPSGLEWREAPGCGGLCVHSTLFTARVGTHEKIAISDSFALRSLVAPSLVVAPRRRSKLNFVMKLPPAAAPHPVKAAALERSALRAARGNAAASCACQLAGLSDHRRRLSRVLPRLKALKPRPRAFRSVLVEAGQDNPDVRDATKLGAAADAGLDVFLSLPDSQISATTNAIKAVIESSDKATDCAAVPLPSPALLDEITGSAAYKAVDSAKLSALDLEARPRLRRCRARTAKRAFRMSSRSRSASCSRRRSGRAPTPRR